MSEIGKSKGESLGHTNYKNRGLKITENTFFFVMGRSFGGIFRQKEKKELLEVDFV